MSGCKDIDTALSKLSGKIDNLSSRLNGLEAKQKECCDQNKQQKPPDTSLEGLSIRISRLENYINSLENGFSQAVEIINKIVNIIQGFFK